MIKHPKYSLYLHAAGMVILAFLAYQFSFSKTTQLLSENNQIEEQLKEYERLSQDEVTALNVQEQKLRSVIGEKTDKEGDFQQNVVNTLTPIGQAASLKLTGIPPSVESQAGGYTFYYSAIEFEGNFKDLLTTMHKAEFQQGIGKLVSVKFESKKLRGQSKMKLYGSMYFQKVAA